MVYYVLCMLPAKWSRQTDPLRLVHPKSQRRNGTRDEHKHLDRIHRSKYVHISLKQHLISIQSFKNALFFQSERVLNIFNMVFQG